MAAARWPVLAGVPEVEAREILARTRRRRFARGEVVFHEADAADSLHLVVSGTFAVETVTPTGDRVLFRIVGPGGWFGEVALLSEPARRTATVSAVEPAETWSLSREDLDVLRRRFPAVTDALVSALAGRVRDLSQLLADALHAPAEDRVANRLRELAVVFAKAGEPSVTIPLTQDQIAGLAGASRVTVNRVLREQQGRGLVELGRGRVVLLRPDAL